jgi:hypothetical protein
MLRVEKVRRSSPSSQSAADARLAGEAPTGLQHVPLTIEIVLQDRDLPMPECELGQRDLAGKLMQQFGDTH